MRKSSLEMYEHLGGLVYDVDEFALVEHRLERVVRMDDTIASHGHVLR